MFSLDSLRYADFSSSLARKFLGAMYRQGHVCKIRFGPLRGTKVVYVQNMSFRFLLGLSDLRAFRLLSAIFKKTSWLSSPRVFVDLGGNRGLYTLWFARLPNTKRVICFEPNPLLAASIRKQITVNGFGNAEVFQFAAADKAGSATLFLGDSDTNASLIEGRARSAHEQLCRIRVDTVSLDEFFFGNGSDQEGPDFIKMDIEGAGVLALPGAVQCLVRKRPLLYVESHSPEEDSAIGQVLRNFDYQALRLQNFRWVKHADKIHPEKDGVWGNLFLCPSEFQAQVYSALGFAASPRRHRRSSAGRIRQFGE